MNKTHKKFLLCAILLSMVYACQKEEESSSSSLEPDIKQTVLGKELKNPYTVENMQKAYDNLQASFRKAGMRIVEEVQLRKTHLYVRFQPKDSTEYDLLMSDKTLDFYDYPLTFEINEIGEYYHDSSIPIDQPTYQYTVVSADYEFGTEVAYEVLADLYLPEEDTIQDYYYEWTAEDTDEYISNGRLNADISFNNLLENEALRITDNLEHEDSPSNAKTNFWKRKSKWTPAGRIRMWDDALDQLVGIEGVEVRARRWFWTKKGKTNSSGDFRCNGRFRNSANYSLKWERYDFSIRASYKVKTLFGDVYYSRQAEMDGPKKRGDWNKDISDGTRDSFHAILFRAAYHYYYQDILGLRRPPQNSLLKAQMKIAARYEVNRADNGALINGTHAKDLRLFGIFSRLAIYNPQRDHDDTYATTIHELAHASHWQLRKNDWINETEKKVKESWAPGVQWVLTRMEYPDYRGKNPFGVYTNVVIDLVDDRAALDPTNFINNGFDDPNLGQEDTLIDDVNGYSMRQIEDVLGHTSTWEEWESNIKNNYENDTEENLEALFDYWDNI